MARNFFYTGKSQLRRCLYQCHPKKSLCFGEAAMFFDESDDIAEQESSLSAGRSVVMQPASVGISPDGCRADAEEAADFFKVKLRIEEAFDEFLSGLFEFAGVIVRRDIVIVKRGKEHDALGQVSPDFLKFGINCVGYYVI